jgi:rsbT co-antagonist protein RsbR
MINREKRTIDSFQRRRKMREQWKYIGQKLVENKYEIAKDVASLLNPDYAEEVMRNTDFDTTIKWHSHFIECLGKSLFSDEDVVREQIRSWAEQTGEGSLRVGLPLMESLKVMTYYRTSISLWVEKYIEEMQLDAKTIVEIGLVIHPLLDYAAQIFSGTYVKYHNQSIDNARAALNELSVPIVSVAAHIAILPLIGIVDTHRAKFLTESTLQKSAKLGLSHLIIDISGVRDMDTMVAGEIFKLHDALRILGIQTVLTGIRPQIAQTAINLGLDFSSLTTYGNLKQALAAAGFKREEQSESK